MDAIRRMSSKRPTVVGRTCCLFSASTYLADNPMLVIPCSSANRHSTSGSGAKGEPSYSITVAPVCKPVISQFHIIHPQVVKKNVRSSGRVLLCRMCSVNCLSSTPPCPCSMHLGFPVVPEENMITIGALKFSRLNVGVVAS